MSSPSPEQFLLDEMAQAKTMGEFISAFRALHNYRNLLFSMQMNKQSPQPQGFGPLGPINHPGTLGPQQQGYGAGPAANPETYEGPGTAMPWEEGA